MTPADEECYDKECVKTVTTPSSQSSYISVFHRNTRLQVEKVYKVMKKTLWGGNQPNTLLLAPMNAHTWELSDVSENPRGCMQCIRACKNLFHQKGSVCLLTVMERKLRRYLTKILQGGCALTPPLYYTASEQPHSRTSNVLEELLASAMFIHTPEKMHALQSFKSELRTASQKVSSYRTEGDLCYIQIVSFFIVFTLPNCVEI